MSSELIELCIEGPQGIIFNGRIIACTAPVNEYRNHVRYAHARFFVTAVLHGKYSIEDGWVTDNTIEFLQHYQTDIQLSGGNIDQTKRLAFARDYTGPDMILGVRG